MTESIFLPWGYSLSLSSSGSLSSKIEKFTDPAVRAALARFEALGATMVPVSLPHTELSIPAYYVIAPAEASSNLARFDGVRYGHRSADASDLKSLYMNSRAEGFGPEVKRRIMIGTYVLSHGYYDAYYRKAQQLRRMIADDFTRVFADVDVIAGPVSPETAWPIGQQTDDPVRNYLADIYTLARQTLRREGVNLIYGGTHCTVLERDTFFSYRRDGQTGRMVSMIWLEKPAGEAV